MIGVLANPGSWYLQDLQRAAMSCHETVVPLSFRHLAARLSPEPSWSSRALEAEHAIDLQSLDAILVRTMPPGTLEQVVFRMNVLHRLQAAGTRVCNPPRCLEVAIDKYLALAELQAAGLPVPLTRTTENWEIAMDDFVALGSDVVVKPIFGGEGRGITRINDEAIAWRCFRTLAQLGCVIYQQQYIEHDGSDIRILRLDEKQFAIRRRNEHDWRTNVSRGAKAEPFQVDATLCQLAQHAAQAISARMVGVDLICDRAGTFYIIEVNAVPGWRALAKTLQVDIAQHVVQLLQAN